MDKKEFDEEKFERAVTIFCWLVISGTMGLLFLGELAVDRISTAIDNKKKEKAEKESTVYRQQDIEDLKKKEAIEKTLRENYRYQR